MYEKNRTNNGKQCKVRPNRVGPIKECLSVPWVCQVAVSPKPPDLFPFLLQLFGVHWTLRWSTVFLLIQLLLHCDQQTSRGPSLSSSILCFLAFIYFISSISPFQFCAFCSSFFRRLWSSRYMWYFCLAAAAERNSSFVELGYQSSAKTACSSVWTPASVSQLPSSTLCVPLVPALWQIRLSVWWHPCGWLGQHSQLEEAL